MFRCCPCSSSSLPSSALHHLRPVRYITVCSNGIPWPWWRKSLLSTLTECADHCSNWDNRAARFFAAFSFALAALGVNISANSLSAANDLMALMPRYVNIRRGQLLTALICWALVPWKILASAGSFLNFMSAYAIFLGPIAGTSCAISNSSETSIPWLWFLPSIRPF
jgi:hypothetical protein